MDQRFEGIIEPRPNEAIISREEKMWRVELPASYRKLLQDYNGGIPANRCFLCNNHEYAIDRFLCVLENAKGNKYSSYDIDVVLSQIEDRLTDNEDLVGCELLPIAQLFAGDYLCINYKISKKLPTVYVWDHEKSGELDPVIYKVASSFDEFLDLLY